MCRASGDRFDAARWSLAETLGVSQKTVNNARRELRQSGKLSNVTQFPKSVEKFSPETFSRPEKLGVDRSLVSRVIKNMSAHIIYHDRGKAREYYEDNPSASYREVADPT